VRQEVLAYINGLALGTFTVTSDLPYDASGNALYLSNVKKIYVDEEQITSEPLVQGMDGTHINNQTTSVSIYFTADAKQLPANYDTIVSGLRGAKDITSVSGVNRREIEESSDFQGDLIVKTLEIRFNTVT
jgi:hypothetical protein